MAGIAAVAAGAASLVASVVADAATVAAGVATCGTVVAAVDADSRSCCWRVAAPMLLPVWLEMLAAAVAADAALVAGVAELVAGVASILTSVAMVVANGEGGAASGSRYGIGSDSGCGGCAWGLQSWLRYYYFVW